MSQDPQDRNDWQALKDQFEELRRCERESGAVPDLDQTFDDQIRHRFGEFIYRATVATSKIRQF